MKRKGTRILVFFLLAGVLLSQLNRVFAFRYEDGIRQMEGFYKQPRGSVDVLVMGSTHAYDIIDPHVLEAEDASVKRKNGGDPGEPFGRAAEGCMAVFLEFPIYHNRYREITFSDFLADYSLPENYRGHVPADHVEAMERPDVSKVTEQMPIAEKTALYFQKLLDLAKQEEIPVLLILTPYIVQEDDQKVYNTVTELVSAYPEEEVKYINFNEAYDEIGIDFATDFADYDHLNVTGCRKFSSYFGKVLRTFYELPDHRNEE